MPLLAAALYNLTTKAENEGIYVQFDVCSTKLTSSATEVQLSDISCLHLQSAIEASRCGDNIYVKIASVNQKTYFEVRNISEVKYSISEISHFFDAGFSTKNTPKKHNQPHGLGLNASHLKEKTGWSFSSRYRGYLVL